MSVSVISPEPPDNNSRLRAGYIEMLFYSSSADRNRTGVVPRLKVWLPLAIRATAPCMVSLRSHQKPTLGWQDYF